MIQKKLESKGLSNWSVFSDDFRMSGRDGGINSTQFSLPLEICAFI